jgi:hypothetical protein
MTQLAYSDASRVEATAVRIHLIRSSKRFQNPRMSETSKPEETETETETETKMNKKKPRVKTMTTTTTKTKTQRKFLLRFRSNE